MLEDWVDIGFTSPLVAKTNEAFLLFHKTYVLLPQSITGQSLLVADYNDRILGPGQSHIQSPSVIEKSNIPFGIWSDTCDEDDVPLLTLKCVDCRYFQVIGLFYVLLDSLFLLIVRAYDSNI